MFKTKLFWFTLLLVFVTSCVEENLQGNDKKNSRLLIVTNANEESFDENDAQTLSELCSRISYTFFYMNGEKVMNTKSQLLSDKSFGALSIDLENGEYMIATIAHNGLGNPTISSPNKATFANNKVTDTFLSFDTIQLNGNPIKAEITLHRCVAMVRVCLNQTLPVEVKQLKFFYKGGSSTLSPYTGRGVVDSRQTEIFDVPTSAYLEAGTMYDLYTFPHNQQDTLSLEISALSSSGEVLLQRSLVNIPVKVGQITQLTGSLEHATTTQNSEVVVKIEGAEWTTKRYNF